jgi:methylated-DNA-[protein]-cysteine S-methyltransferase
VQIVAYHVPGWGTGELWLDGEVVVNHELPSSRRERKARAGPVPRLRERLLAYFRGEQVAFADVELDLEGATPFQSAVVEALRAVPYGETVTYGELAVLAGYPNAYRAAGTVCARNRFPLFVPCHRVVASGSLGPYGSAGTEYKRRLLELEGVAV